MLEKQQITCIRGQDTIKSKSTHFARSSLLQENCKCSALLKMALTEIPSWYCWDFRTDTGKGVHISEWRPDLIQQSSSECDLWWLLHFASHKCVLMYNLTDPPPRWRPRLKPEPERGAPGGLQTPSSGSHTGLWGQSRSWRSACLCRPSQTSPASVHNTEEIIAG